MHPLLHLIATQPQLLADHAEAYADLIGDEIGSASAQWKRRVALNALALCLGGAGVVLAGVALMLWGAIPPESMPAPWALVAAPALPLMAAIGCWVAGRSAPAAATFDNVRRQMRADVAMLREVSAS